MTSEKGKTGLIITLQPRFIGAATSWAEMVLLFLERFLVVVTLPADVAERVEEDVDVFPRPLLDEVPVFPPLEPLPDFGSDFKGTG